MIRRVIEQLSARTNANARAAGRLAAELADDAAVDDRDHARACGHRRDDPLDPGARALGEVLHALGSRDDVPALLREHLADDGVARGQGDPERATVQVAEVHLAQLGDDDGLEPGGLRDRLRGLGGAAQRRDEQRLQRLAGEERRDAPRLLDALGRQRRVRLALEQLERLAVDGRLRGAVAHEQDLDRLRRARVVALRVAAFGHGVGG